MASSSDKSASSHTTKTESNDGCIGGLQKPHAFAPPPKPKVAPRTKRPDGAPVNAEVTVNNKETPAPMRAVVPVDVRRSSAGSNAGGADNAEDVANHPPSPDSKTNYVKGLLDKFNVPGKDLTPVRRSSSHGSNTSEDSNSGVSDKQDNIRLAEVNLSGPAVCSVAGMVGDKPKPAVRTRAQPDQSVLTRPTNFASTAAFIGANIGKAQLQPNRSNHVPVVLPLKPKPVKAARVTPLPNNQSHATDSEMLTLSPAVSNGTEMQSTAKNDVSENQLVNNDHTSANHVAGEIASLTSQATCCQHQRAQVITTKLPDTVQLVPSKAQGDPLDAQVVGVTADDDWEDDDDNYGSPSPTLRERNRLTSQTEAQDSCDPSPESKGDKPRMRRNSSHRSIHKKSLVAKVNVRRKTSKVADKKIAVVQHTIDEHYENAALQHVLEGSQECSPSVDEDDNYGFVETNPSENTAIFAKASQQLQDNHIRGIMPITSNKPKPPALVPANRAVSVTSAAHTPPLPVSRVKKSQSHLLPTKPLAVQSSARIEQAVRTNGSTASSHDMTDSPAPPPLLPRQPSGVSGTLPRQIRKPAAPVANDLSRSSSPLNAFDEEFSSPPIPPRVPTTLDRSSTRKRTTTKHNYYPSAGSHPRPVTSAHSRSSTSQSVGDLRPQGVERNTSNLSLTIPPSNTCADPAAVSPSHSENLVFGYMPMDSQTPRNSSRFSRVPFTLPNRDSAHGNVTQSHDSTRSGITPSSHNSTHTTGGPVVRTASGDAIECYYVSPEDIHPRHSTGSIEKLDSVYVPLEFDDVAMDYAPEGMYDSHSSLYGDEPLYQIYHQGAVVRDVIQQDAGDDLECQYASPGEYLAYIKNTASDILKRKEAGIPEEEDVVQSVRGLSSLESAAAKSDVSFKKLWCETTAVKNSGVLSHMNMEEMRLQESMFEIITSEASYLKSMNILVGHFMNNFSLKLAKDKDMLSRQDFTWLFSNSKAVRDVSIRTLEALEKLWLEGCVLKPVELCRVLMNIAQQHYSVYVTYCTNAVYQDRKFHQLMEKNSEFSYTVSRLEAVADCRSLPLSSFLALPMQRITRLPLLVNAVVHRMKPYDAKSPDVTNCITILQQIVKQCNDGAKKMENVEQMMNIFTSLVFRPTKNIPEFMSQSRYLIKKGPVTHVLKQTTGFLKRSKKSLYFFLFNDLLIITKKKSEKQYEVVEHSPRSSVHADMIQDEDVPRWLPGGVPIGCKHLFFMVLMEQKLEYILSCASLNERMRWVQAFIPPDQVLGDGEEKIYESWDCPQVQAVRQYTARQPDELSLEESDIVNVLRKLTDGWYLGERMRDGEKGWFPVSFTVEIQNHHVRMRNLRQHYRVLTKALEIVGHNTASC